MNLTEGEGKTFLKDAGITVPEFFLLEKDQPLPDSMTFPVVAKAQTLVGGRGKAGLVKEAADTDELNHALESIWKARYQKRPFSQVLVEPKIDIAREYYLSFVYDQELRSPALVFSKFGGMDIETVAKRQPDAVIKVQVNPLKGIDVKDIEQLCGVSDIKTELCGQMVQIIEKTYEVFIENDAELVEINPLIETKEGKLIAADCKMVLDDTAMYRHEFDLPKRSGFRELTDMEQAARAIDARSHRGVVGRTFLELDGDIGFMSSGGGASITCLDALISYGGRPANFVEYSGNPEREDVRDLAKLILSKEGLKALWVVGPTANFTDIYETLGGIMDALNEVRPAFPVVIRRAGPRDDEAKKLVEQTAKETGMDISFYGEELSMTESAKVLIDKISSL